MKRGFPTIVWVLLGLLGLSAFMLSLGQRDLFANPAMTSYGPSGTSALAQLLRDRGHLVEVDRRPRPKLGANDVALAFTDYDPLSSDVESKSLETIGEALRKHAENGGNVVLIEIPKQFQDVSRRLINATPDKVKDLGRNREYEVTADFVPTAAVRLPVTEDDDFSIQLWSAGENDFVRGYRIGKGNVLLVSGGIGFTNRFIDRLDNAAAGISIVELLAKKKPGSRVVFTEAAFGNERVPGLLDTIGMWAVASWYQVLFLGVVIVFTLGRRFGYAEVDPVRQRGARELLDAIADTYLRGRHAQVALRIILARVESDLRAALRLGRDFEISARDERLSPELRQAMAEAYAALTWDRVRSDDALPIVRKLLKAKAEFVQQRRGLGA